MGNTTAQMQMAEGSHESQLNVHFSSERQDWATPQWLFDHVSKWRGGFNLDVCASEENTKCVRWIGFGENGLKHSWKGDRVWMNPPYGRDIGDWTRKARDSNAELVCGLLPARTDTQWWHEDVMEADEIYLLRGRIKFEGAQASAPFPSALVFWNSGDSCVWDGRPHIASLKLCPP